jgi:hypothetical protein
LLVDHFNALDPLAYRVDLGQQLHSLFG